MPGASTSDKQARLLGVIIRSDLKHRIYQSCVPRKIVGKDTSSNDALLHREGTRLIRRDSALYRLFHLQLIDHQPEERDIEWWARCRLEHICVTPYLAYDILRTLIAGVVFSTFMSTTFVALFALSGVLLGACQRMIDRRRKSHDYPHSATLALASRLIVLRTVLWSIFSGVALYHAPPSLLVAFLPTVVMVLWIESIALIAAPRIAVLNAAINGLGIALPLAFVGGLAAIGGTGGALASFLALHWLVFHLNYMFATRRLRTRKLTEANETIQLLLNQYDQDGSDWLFECTEDGRILRPSRRFCEASGRSVERLEGMQLLDLFYDSPERAELREMGGQDESFQRLVVPLYVRGEHRWWSISARKVTSNDDATQRYWRGFVADVTCAREAEARIKYMAHYDVLTDLPNRALFNATIKRAFDRLGADGMVAVLAIDLDHFKTINDTFGHAGGDAALEEAARRIEQCVPPGAMVARFGGDEFAVLIEHPLSRERGFEVAQKIVDAMKRPVNIEGQKAPVGASVGIAFAPFDGATSEEVIYAADLALYDAKSRGRKAASVFEPRMHDEVQERHQLEMELRDALTNGELELHYQPLVDTQSMETVGYEALLRWNHPKRGPVSPEVFIPIAEDNGQIVQIGTWVLREALAEAARWPDHLTISVNLSPVQTMDAELYGIIVHTLAASGVSAHRLELEITESVLMRECDETIALLHKIRALGVRIALDDFGTGYSSLNYLRAFPFDKIKIDRCFVGDIAERESSDTIVQAVIALATRLKMRTTAEGIENAEQMERLRATECSQMQGYLFSRALPASQLTHRIVVEIDDEMPVARLESTQPAQERDAGHNEEDAPARSRQTG